MATLKEYTYSLRFSGAPLAHTISVSAYCVRQAAGDAYSEACKLGAKPGNVEAFDLVRVEVV